MLHGEDPVELVERSLSAIDVAQPLINAFVTVDADRARADAAAARAERASGHDRGPLHGVPVAVKDIVDTAGLRTTMGSRHFADHIPGTDAVVVRRLRSAGAIVVGKTTTHEFAFGPTGDRAANGPGGNPHDPTRMAGGSSAGSAAAVGAGLVPLAIGTDTGGSVRIPAALCGVTGIRPSMGRVPTDGVFPLSWSLDTVGTLAADVAGTAAGWHVLAGTRPVPSPGLTSLHLGRVEDAWFDRLDETVRRGFAAAVLALERRGARIGPAGLPDAADLLEIYRTVQLAEALAIHRERLATAPELFEPETRQRLEAAAAVSAPDYAVALRRMADLRASAGERLDGFDVLLLPTVPVVAPPIGARDTELGGGWTSPRDALLAHNAGIGVLGLPAISLPIGDGAGLPVGLQLVGRPGQDELLLATALTVERALRP